MSPETIQCSIFPRLDL
ncbi:hypothetical protein Hypma_013790 [Hypsizygus marmoreus]|uniref:Uncharacterized protein n=1 Tax=Hypsizygus marmoreus TaxID=39966 RepID=A0A369K5P8_HYPMA|nr:hypothetical protein Hypma_013790 [Hypsizygus marmoreus]